MDLSPSDRQRQRQALAADFALREVLPCAAALDRAGAIPPELLAALFASGLAAALGVDDDGHVEAWIAVEELGRASASLGAVLGAHTLVCGAVARFGGSAQRAPLLGALSTQKLGACSMLDALALRGADGVRAERTPSGWRLSGVLPNVQNAPVAGLILLGAECEGKGAPRRVFVLPSDAPGLLRREPEAALGLHATPTCTLALNDCRLPDEARLGAPGEGLAVGQHLAHSACLNVASQALGVARAALHVALEHVRSVRNTPFAAGQGTQFALVDLISDVDAAELLVRKAATCSYGGAASDLGEAALAALHACETALRVSHGAARIVSTGPHGSAYDLDRYMRDAHAIGRVTTALRAVVAGHVLDQG